MRSSTTLPVIQEWTKQASFDDGTLEVPSLVIEVREDLGLVLERLTEMGVPVWQNGVVSDNGFPKLMVRDPMGMTLEVSTPQ